MFTGRWLWPICLLFGGVGLALLLPSLPVLAQGSQCDEIRLYPSDRVEAEHKDGYLVISSLVGLRQRVSNDPVQFTIQLKVGEDILAETIRKLPVQEEVGLEVLFLVDLDPRLLAVPPGSEDSSGYYLALVWAGILSQFGFTGSPAGTNRGLVAMPPAKIPAPAASGNALFNLFVKELPKLAEMPADEARSQTSTLLNNWLNEVADRPRMAVVLRWQQGPATSEEYDFANPQQIPVVVVDVDQRFEPHAEEIRGAGGEVIFLGPTPKRVRGYWPNPWDPGWSNDEKQIPAQVNERVSPITQGQIGKIQNVFVLKQEWPFLIDSGQLSNLRVNVSTQMRGLPVMCSVPLHFSTSEEGRGERLLGGIGVTAFVTSTAAIFMSILWIVCLIDPVGSLYRNASGAWRQWLNQLTVEEKGKKDSSR